MSRVQGLLTSTEAATSQACKQDGDRTSTGAGAAPGAPAAELLSCACVRKCLARAASAAMVAAYCTRADSSGSLGIIDSDGSTYLRTSTHHASVHGGGETGVSTTRKPKQDEGLQADRLQAVLALRARVRVSISELGGKVRARGKVWVGVEGQV